MAARGCWQGLLQLLAPPALEDPKERRRKVWGAAQQGAKDFLRKWLQAHPGEEVPESVFLACEASLKRAFPDLGEENLKLSFVRHSFLELLRTEGPPERVRSPADWEALFPRYPALEDGCFRKP